MVATQNDIPPPTRREMELIGLIARGLQNKNIAFELSISENTVRAHIGNIMRKYKLHNRTQIAVMFGTGAPVAAMSLVPVGERAEAAEHLDARIPGL